MNPTKVITLIVAVVVVWGGAGLATWLLWPTRTQPAPGSGSTPPVAAPALPASRPAPSLTVARSEELVRHYIERNVQDPQALTFQKWGPHMDATELGAILDEAGVGAHVPALSALRFKHLIRVCYRSPSPVGFALRGSFAPSALSGTGEFDQVFVVQGDFVHLHPLVQMLATPGGLFPGEYHLPGLPPWQALQQPPGPTEGAALEQVEQASRPSDRWKEHFRTNLGRWFPRLASP